MQKTNLVTNEQCMKDKDQDAEEKEDNNALSPKLNNTPLVLKEVTKVKKKRHWILKIFLNLTPQFLPIILLFINSITY